MQTTTATTAKRSSSRQRLLADLPATERRIDVAGISTAVLEGGAGSPVILLHGPAAHAGAWMRVLPALVARHRVIAPDLPGHGASGSATPMSVERMIAWLGELIRTTCASPPAVVGHALGGAIAARFAAAHGDAIGQLVLVDTLGLTPFQPVPEFGQAIHAYFENPTPESHHELWRYCAHDIESVRRQMGERWQPFEDYNLELVGTPSVMSAAQSMLTLFASSAIPDAELARIAVTALVWGREDLAIPLAVAEAASKRYRWPLHVIDGCADDPPIEKPQDLVRILRDVIDDREVL
jgi:pimeloyl-ACP methyl ester carboxylesterase